MQVISQMHLKTHGVMNNVQIEMLLPLENIIWIGPQAILVLLFGFTFNTSV